MKKGISKGNNAPLPLRWNKDLTYGIHQAPRRKPIRMVPRREIYDYYTDVLDHRFNPMDSRQLVIGTSFGELVIVEDTAEGNYPYMPELTYRFKLPNATPVVSLSWGGAKNDLFIASKRTVYYLDTTKPKDFKFNFDDESVFNLKDSRSRVPEVIYRSLFSDIMDLAFVPDTEDQIFVSCDDGTSRLYDLTARKTVSEFRHHSGALEVCEAGDNYIMTGGADGLVCMYDSKFRTNEPIGVFDNKSPVNNLAISRNSTWMAITGADSSEFPNVYNIGTRQLLPTSVEKNGDTGRIYAVTFDSFGGLYWGGPEGIVYKSEDLQTIYSGMKARYGRGKVRQVYTITTAFMDHRIRVCAAGSTNGVMFSSTGSFWDGMLHV